MCIKTTVLVLTVRGLAPPAAATHGCWIIKAPPPAPAMGIVRTPAPVVKRSLKPSTQAGIVTPMGAGHSIPTPSTGVKVTAGIAAIRIMNMPVTA